MTLRPPITRSLPRTTPISFAASREAGSQLRTVVAGPSTASVRPNSNGSPLCGLRLPSSIAGLIGTLGQLPPILFWSISLPNSRNDETEELLRDS